MRRVCYLICFIVLSAPFWPKALGQNTLNKNRLHSEAALLRINEWYDEAKHKPKQSYEVLKAKPSVLNGLYEAWYQSGIKKSVGNYHQGKPSGFWENFYENGKPKSKGQMSGSGPVGLWKYYYENGNPKSEGIMNGTIREGAWKFFYESGRVSHSGTMKNGQFEGKWTYFNEDESLKGTAYYKKGKGFYKQFYPNGNLQMQGLIVNGESDSTWQYYSENGKIISEGQEKNGIKNGFWRYYYENGKTESEGNYQNGLKNGTWKYYHENGVLSSAGLQRAGKREGDWKMYYESGKFMGEGKFENGNGLYKEYHENGKLKLSGLLVDGVHTGEWRYFFDDGSVEGICNYINGEGEYQGYYRNGQTRMKGMLKNGKKTGTWNIYKEDGQQAAILRFFSDKEAPANAVVQIKDTLKRPVVKILNPAKMKFRKSGNRYFSKQINEDRGFILSLNPLAIIISSFPIALEYRFRDRLAYELTYSILRNPFLSSIDNLESNTVGMEGYSLGLRQKLCHEDHGHGSMYYGQEIRFTDSFYKTTVQDYTDPNKVKTDYSGYVTRYEFSLLLGWRFFHDIAGNHSLTVDIFGGAGIGYKKVVMPANRSLFPDVNYNKLALPLRAGFTVGMFF